MKPLRMQDEGLAAAASASVETVAIPVTAAAIPNRVRDVRETNATPRLARFLALAAQLALLQFVFTLYHTMEQPTFLRLTGLTFAAFLVHYWLPFRFKEPFFAAVSIGGAFFLLQTRVAELLVLAGLVFFLILRAPVRNIWRITALVAIFAALMYCCANKVAHIPSQFYPVFGAIFMFRLVVYAYDMAHSREKGKVLPFLSYFYLLPNYLFTLFPVIDFQTMRRTYYQRNIHETAQQGIHWMVRGAVQLMLYRLVVYFNDPFLPDRVNTPGKVVATIVLTYLLYLNVSGQFHIIVGLLKLFGYDLPETHRRYLLASSIMDFWRRINIYWKDFMVKIVYFPVYFRLRKKGDLRAQLLATAAVFVVTWSLHSYQFFWIRGRFNIGWTDTIFWTILGLLVMANVLWDNSHRKKKAPDTSITGRAIHAVQILGTFVLITTLWSLWSSPSVSSWVYLTTHWAHRG